MAPKKNIAVLVFAVGLFFVRQCMKGGWCYSKERIDGKVVIVTGANTGIGRETALDLVRRGADVVLACRDEAKCQQAQKYIMLQCTTRKACRTASVMTLDLASLKSIKRFADDFKKEYKKLDVLINNAGIFSANYSKTDDGFESDFGVNHLGPFYLTNLLLDLLISSAPSRIINLSSRIYSYGTINFEDLMSEQGFSRFGAYSNSKLANVLFTRELAKKLKGKGVTSYAVHPGRVRTELGRYVTFTNLPVIKEVMWLLKWPFTKDATEGAQTTICCAVNKSLADQSGKYYADCEETELVTPEATDDIIASRLWEVSNQLVGLKDLETK